MAEIRSASSGLPSPHGAPLRPASEARAAAQRAFFQQALGQPQATPAAAPPVAASLAAVRPQVTVAASRVTETPLQGEAPQRYLRPGSLLDIKV